MRFLPRFEQRTLRRLLRSFPAVLITGPRQCGKSTFAQSSLRDWTRLDLERPSDWATLNADIEGFFQAHPNRVIVDEAQRLPALFPALRYIIDQSKTKGRFVLLGSASPSLLQTASESLAGRIAFLELTPFRAVELAATSFAKDRWFWGGYPPVHALRGTLDRVNWFDSYVSTFLERDLPGLGLKMPAQRLRTLWTMLTHVHGNLLNVSDLARSLAVSTHTVNHYLDVLEGAFMIRRLHPYHANVQKRLAKSPKVYVRDTGLLHFLSGLRKPEDLDTWPRRGQSFEGLVVEEIATWAASRFVRPHITFWRTQAGAEVDLLIGDGTRLFPIEIKLGSSVDQYAIVGLRQCMKDLHLEKGWIIANVPERRRVAAGIEIVPWQDTIKRGFDFR